MTQNPEILIIKSDKDELKRVEKFLFQFFETNHLPRKYLNKVFLCISEAVVNSIEHGNKCDKTKEVFIQVYHYNDELCVVIHDQGEGFNYECLDDPTCQNNIKKESGRGIYIMKSISNQLDFHKQGSMLKIKFNIK